MGKFGMGVWARLVFPAGQYYSSDDLITLSCIPSTSGGWEADVFRVRTFGKSRRNKRGQKVANDFLN